MSSQSDCQAGFCCRVCTSSLDRNEGFFEMIVLSLDVQQNLVDSKVYSSEF